jgi:DNA-binding XRE family transcriptional regulator
MNVTTRRISGTVSPSRQFDRVLFDALTEAQGAITIDQKATLIGVSRNTVYRWHNTGFNGGMTLADDIAGRLGTDIDSLFPVRSQPGQ